MKTPNFALMDCEEQQQHQFIRSTYAHRSVHLHLPYTAAEQLLTSTAHLARYTLTTTYLPWRARLWAACYAVVGTLGTETVPHTT